MGTASEKDLRKWFEKGKEMGAAHMVVVSDMTIFEEQPRYIMKGENVLDRILAFQGKRLKVGPVYNLNKDIGSQITKNAPVPKKKAASNDFF